LCFGGIWWIHADLRREFGWGNFDLGFFEDLGGFPRGSIEEGDQWCALLEFIGVNWIDFGGGACKL
jgi:hypothetical protein